ncbi:LPS assembly protein LptD [Opitutus sp. GAS368]|uniref:LPS-assembly protein LptD n=1 Tax=Opitutus sp. GAS368 TaxID=1882749 RepID=UPI00087BDB98|nr:LPS assembly protein LptD [Opitutus sp. GAS368]SDS54084.1 LPS-assembly protein [Opitutus sp. GAS368]
MSFVRRLPALLGTVGLLAGLAHAQPTVPDQLHVSSDKNAVYDDVTKETLLTGNARMVNGDTTLTADAIRYNSTTGVATATGHFVLTSGRRRLVADEGTYNLATREINVRNLRIGEFPIYISGDTVTGTPDNLVFTNALVFFRENAGYTPSIRAEHLTYARGRIVSAEGLSLGLLGGHFISLPHFEQALDTDFVSFISAHLGYRGNLGLFAELGLHVPVAPGLQAGADIGLYSSRGVLLGPSGTYGSANSDINGFFRSGYISDSGDRKTDVLGQPVPRDRSYVTWEHRQRAGDHFTLDGEFNYWSDSEVLRDFRYREFETVQQPDSFLEAAYTGDNYSLSAFTRVRPNSWEHLPERLPEVRFDLFPSAVPLGFYQRGSASAAVLEADAFGSSPGLRTNRLDAYYGLERPYTPTPWFTFTPVAGGRVTYYTDALGGKSTYTRTLGEIGFDAHLLASGTFGYKNPIWEIDGLRHLIEPKLSYRYAPEAARGTAYIPPIDARVFSTYLQPLSIADSRNLDDLGALNTFRLSLDNTFQTRDPSYGSRNLASLNFAADYRLNNVAGQKNLSDIYTEFALTPAPWLKWEVFHRFDPHATSQQELNTGLEIHDQEWWSVRLATNYLRQNYEQYFLQYRQRLNEIYDVTALWRYDARNHRFNEQRYGIWQRLGQTWAIKYEIAWFSGDTRTSSFALNIEVELLKF